GRQLALPQCWTKWFNRDDPSGSGDWETLDLLYHENPGMICNRPLRMQVRTTSGHSVSSTGNVITMTDTRNGFVCKNSDQQPGSECANYEVRFLCPQEFCHPKVCWTRWFDQDSPSGIGDFELLCDLRAENPGQICESPLYIEVVTKHNHMPADFTGQSFHIYSPTEGFVCRNRDQKNRRCYNYKVRYGCPCDV
uniref:WxxW domain-containing protein n=1 Tax=Periophthalmus magnuspinnatus TaxID=409849 RepID=A0A3B4AAX2_9GOBI